MISETNNRAYVVKRKQIHRSLNVIYIHLIRQNKEIVHTTDTVLNHFSDNDVRSEEVNLVMTQ